MTGWTWDVVRDQMDIPRLEVLREAWQHNPPLAVTMKLAAEAQGVEFKTSSVAAPGANESGSSEGGIDPYALAAELGTGVMPTYVPPVKSLPLN